MLEDAHTGMYKPLAGKDRALAEATLHAHAARSTHAAPNRPSAPLTDDLLRNIVAAAAGKVPAIHHLDSVSLRRTGERARVKAWEGHAHPVHMKRGGGRRAVVDLTVVVEYGTAIAQAASQVRESVARAVCRVADADVVEVNVSVTGVAITEP
ncbi:Asp23/Gls24 family envelope stress response protein [Streptomyces sp. NPDC088116]|uniref:Asp23/Gls24 family envelope stress response protein n=1 Tax=Streptomyces sp. NPDC088116 TaxID=3365825 RepID=UPI0037F7204C